MLIRLLLIIAIVFISNYVMAETIDLLSNTNTVRIKFIPQNEKHANVIIENKTNKPVSIRLPRSFAAIPVLAQQVGGAGFNNGGIQPFNNGMGFNNGGIQPTQRVAGAFASTDIINIKPNGKKVIAVNTLCIDYGVPVPNPRINYAMVSIEEVSSDSRLSSVVDLMSNSKIDQQLAQALAWHINSGVSIESLVRSREISASQAALARSHISQL